MSDNKKSVLPNLVSVSLEGPKGSNFKGDPLKASDDDHKMTKWLDINSNKLETAINKSRTTQIKYLLLYNFLFGCIFFFFNYVIQKDYTSYDMTRIQSKLQGLLRTDICPFLKDGLRGNEQAEADIKEMLLGLN